MNISELMAGICGVVITVGPIIFIVFVLAWLKDIRTDNRKIKEVLKKRFPEEFKD